jgi:hypothetical protein
MKKPGKLGAGHIFFMVVFLVGEEFCRFRKLYHKRAGGNTVRCFTTEAQRHGDRGSPKLEIDGANISKEDQELSVDSLFRRTEYY